MKPLATLLLLALAAHTACAAGYLQAVEFPYYLYPPTLWERELTWLKNIGVQTVEFSVPAHFHQPQPGECDLTGRTSPRRDLVGFVRLLRKLGLRAWVRPLPPVPGLVNARLDAAQQRAWLRQLEQVLATQTVSHGGPIAFVEGRVLAIDAGAPPSPVITISAMDANAFARSREAMGSARGALLWTDVEDALYPAGWAANPSTLLHKGAVGLSGDERPATAALRRDAALLRGWERLFADLRHVTLPKPAAGHWPEGVSVLELVSPAASVISVTNASQTPFHDDLRVVEPLTRRTLLIPGARVKPRQSLWLPLAVSLGPDGLCRECTNFAATEHVVYATAELLSIESENGILAMEFAAPEPGEVILQLARRPTGPFLAAGKPTDFDWDEPHMRARLQIPAGTQQGHRVRIGIAIEAPDTSAFFNDLHRLVIGRKNAVSTMYSSAEVAARSRLRMPEGYTATSATKSPNEIDYEISVPADAIHGDFANLALEADGVALGRARIQLFRPASIRLLSGMQFHIGPQTEITPEPPIAAIDPKGGGNLEISIRNNSSQIQTYRLEPAGQGLEFLPPKTDVSIGPTDERRVEFRVFPAEGTAGVRDWTLKTAGGADLAMPMRVVLVPRATSVAWTADLDGDGTPEWILESAKVRAVFSAEDGGRWMEFTWKDTNTNFLPETGIFAQPGPVEVRHNGDALEFTGKGWKRTVMLRGAALTVEQSTPLPPETLATEKRGNLTLTVEHPAATRAVYGLH
ncbi:MAG: beta-galactosidase [Candidatus Solibacter sp.]|nr:beta-galactosidase [Candidatus Solibacter sp.]